MIKNYFKIALRSLWKRKIFSLINITGLAIGISASLIIYLMVQFDFSFDKQHKDGDRIYRVVSENSSNGEVYKIAGVPLPMFEAVKNEVSGVELAVPLITSNSNIQVSGPAGSGIPLTSYRHNAKLIYTNSNYFKLLNYQWIAGSPATALDKPLQTVLTEERAIAYFPHLKITDIIGRQLIYDDTILTTVTGVVGGIKGNTDFTFKEFISLATLTNNTELKNEDRWHKWGGVNSADQLFVKLLPNVSSKKMEVLLTDLLIKKRTEENGINKSKCQLQALDDLHFNPVYSNFNQRQADKSTLYALLIIAIFLLLLGCINFINLSTAQATERAKEIGVRKSVGAFKYQLVCQFLTETTILSLLAAVVSVLISPILLGLFKDFIPPGITPSFIYTKNVFYFLFLLVIIISLLAGLYPSFILTKFKPALVLKGQLISGNSGKQNNNFRRLLTVSQFAIAQFFIIATLVVAQQIHYSLTKDLGFKTDAIAFISFPWKGVKPDTKFVLLNKIQKLQGIEKSSMGGSPPSSNGKGTGGLSFMQGSNEIEINVEYKEGDSNFFSLYHLKLLAGRVSRPSEKIKEYVINETCAKKFGFAKPEDAIGKLLHGGMSDQDPIVGVMADFHTASTREAIKPVVFTSNENLNTLHFAFAKSADGVVAWQKTLSAIEGYWKQLYPGEPFKYHFFDESIAAFYKKETNTMKLLQWSSGLAIFISSLGLLGLVIFMANQRTKEIGIRKVLGATVAQIVFILSKDFIKLVLIALLIATPVAWYCMHKWLQDFVYRINMPLWVFIVTGLSAVCIAFVTVGFQAIKAAIMNPVKSLKSE